MRKTAIIMAIAAIAANAADLRADDAADEFQAQVLNREIAELRQKVLDESKTLDECAKKVKGFKIAGGVTLGLTAVGVGVNVYQAIGRNKTAKEITSVDSKLTDAKKTLEALQTARKMSNPDAIAGIDIDGPLNEQQKNTVQQFINQGKTAVADLKKARTEGHCVPDCSQTIQDLETTIGKWEHKLSAA
ncbi:MAG: hypothetical protein LBT45_02680 [Rickettsiales bacterium]|jgi:hypothetical protein|nr:hypothetical protein [Rickettsiales bacterium]